MTALFTHTQGHTRPQSHKRRHVQTLANASVMEERAGTFHSARRASVMCSCDTMFWLCMLPRRSDINDLLKIICRLPRSSGALQLLHHLCLLESNVLPRAGFHTCCILDVPPLLSLWLVVCLSLVWVCSLFFSLYLKHSVL